MFPILYQSDSILIPAWHTLYVLGALAGFFVFTRLGRYHNPDLSSEFLSRLFTICYLSGYFGARTFSIFNDEAELVTFSERLTALLRLGPMTFYGGAIAATGAGILYVLIQKRPLADILDLAMPAGLVALGIGRIGCFLNGDDYGLPIPTQGSTTPWWAVVFPNLEDGIARYPVQLWESGSVFLLATVLILCLAKLRTKFGRGSVGLMAVISYAILRFAIEYFRGDDRGWVIANTISTSQFISIVVGLAALFGLLVVRNKRNTRI